MEACSSQKQEERQCLVLGKERKPNKLFIRIYRKKFLGVWFPMYRRFY